MPSGASTGAHEAVELRDGDKSRYGGKGVLQGRRERATRRSRRRCSGRMPPTRPPSTELLIELDGTPNKGKLGANAILGVSLAVRARGGRRATGLPLYRYLGGADARTLPVPMFNILNGGKHAADSTDFQEFMVMPVGAPSFREALRAGAEIFPALRKVLHDGGHATGRATRAASRRRCRRTRPRSRSSLKAIERAGYKPGEDVVIALDPATTELVDVDAAPTATAS